jgi:hypothetical protein
MQEIMASALPNFRRGIAAVGSAILPFCCYENQRCGKSAHFAEDENTLRKDASPVLTTQHLPWPEKISRFCHPERRMRQSNRNNRARRRQFHARTVLIPAYRIVSRPL